MAIQFETTTGLVERISSNGSGLKLVGNTTWLNVSQFRPLKTMPEPGQRVDVQHERGYIKTLRVLDDGKVHDLPPDAQRIRQPRAGRPQTDSRIISRLAVLKAAAEFAAGRPDVKSNDVLRIASAWLLWVERPEPSPTSESKPAAL